MIKSTLYFILVSLLRFICATYKFAYVHAQQGIVKQFSWISFYFGRYFFKFVYLDSRSSKHSQAILITTFSCWIVFFYLVVYDTVNWYIACPQLCYSFFGGGTSNRHIRWGSCHAKCSAAQRNPLCVLRRSHPLKLIN